MGNYNERRGGFGPGGGKRGWINTKGLPTRRGKKGIGTQGQEGRSLFPDQKQTLVRKEDCREVAVRAAERRVLGKRVGQMNWEGGRIRREGVGGTWGGEELEKRFLPAHVAKKRKKK